MKKKQLKIVPRPVPEESTGQRFLDIENRLINQFQYDRERLYGSWQESFS